MNKYEIILYILLYSIIGIGYMKLWVVIRPNQSKWYMVFDILLWPLNLIGHAFIEIA